ncbi:MAG: hypothetical protein PG981_000603 [Wolbachia endosymbiont of Ctenocephalides orientis wCori]|nr:MAG: hypothetical protein PG981_000603 [Wolbachia endosymbiont of Ctenocephalides orientis wCori]
MHKNNITLRTGIEGMQNAIHAGKNRQAPPPSSPLYPGSVANNELLGKIQDDNTRKAVKDLCNQLQGRVQS